MRTSISLAAGLLSVLAAGGCGSPPAAAEVEGRVTVRGKPVAGAEVLFYPITDGAEAPPHAVGVTDDAGAYQLTLSTGRPGAVVGRTRVAVSYPPPTRGDDPDKPPPRLRPAVDIPIQYTVLSSSPLVVEVQPGGRQTINLPLDE